MITLNELAEELTTTTESGIPVATRWDHIADFDQTITITNDGDTEISNEDAEAIREAWSASSGASEGMLQQLCDAQETVEAMQNAHETAISDRDKLITKAHQSGTPATELARLTELSPQLVHRIIKRSTK